jgi:5-(carboxyamino)imidazole ribonucleotide mutase
MPERPSIQRAQPEVLILMGSASDWKYLQGSIELLRELGVSFRVHVSSAHRTPQRTIDFVRDAEAAGCKVFICAAGMAAHLAGAVAAQTVRPVLGVPLPGGVMDGLDALVSTVQMPAGIPVATFAVGSAGASNAALFAAQIIGVENVVVKTALENLRRTGADKVAAADEAVQAEIAGRDG